MQLFCSCGFSVHYSYAAFLAGHFWILQSEIPSTIHALQMERVANGAHVGNCVLVLQYRAWPCFIFLL